MPGLSTPRYERPLRLTLPYLRGADVRAVQARLIARDPAFARLVGPADGLFGPATERAVRAFQARESGRLGLAVDGIVGPRTWAALFAEPDRSALDIRRAADETERAVHPLEILRAALPDLTRPHRVFSDSVAWMLTPDGVAIDGAAPVGSGGEPRTVRALLAHPRIGPALCGVCRETGVPIELALATVATESAGGQTEPRGGDHGPARGARLRLRRGNTPSRLGRPDPDPHLHRARRARRSERGCRPALRSRNEPAGGARLHRAPGPADPA
ncbi:MAG: peptidoglycan-binding domain-containing protein [Acetobacteraceae bacterium]|nr:peptidoglycan-binding domain-containing protein [Acetobacteraceae bacterium]